MSLPLLFALFAAVAYASGALLLKRVGDFGVGVWRTAFVANAICGLCFQPLLLLGGEWQPALWWQPVVVAAFFFAGQWCTFLAFDRGDVSVATPVLGIKVLLVTVIVAVAGTAAIPGRLWIAAALATAGIALLNRRGRGGAHRHVGFTIVLATLAAAAYACFDVLVQTWSPRWGLGRFLPLTIGLSGLLSFIFLLRARAPLRAIPRPAWPWLIGGSAVLGLQSLLFVSTLAHWGQAPAANVVYASRGLWAVLLVWLVGHWVGSREQHLGRDVLVGRLAGAGLMMSAIGLVLG